MKGRKHIITKAGEGVGQLESIDSSTIFHTTHTTSTGDSLFPGTLCVNHLTKRHFVPLRYYGRHHGMHTGKPFNQHLCICSLPRNRQLEWKIAVPVILKKSA